MALKSNGVTQVPDGLGPPGKVLIVNSAGTAGEWGDPVISTRSDVEGLGIDVPATNLTGTIPAARLSTATTQAESDDSTKIATTAYVVDKITTLIGGAPSTLNDLNELAAAINDDANYNSTLTTALATKLPLAGGAITGNITFGDNNKAIFGAGSDLQIYHDGSNSYIRDGGTGGLFLQGSNTIVLEDPDGNNMIYAQDGGPVVLYYNASIRLSTTTGGVNVDGNLTLTGTVDGRDVATDGTKLDGIEASADVTDTANVTAAGALMDSEVTNLAQVKAFDTSDYATAAQGTTADAALPKAGGTLTGNINFGDNDKAVFGTGSDLQIYHDGSNSYIDDAGQGVLAIRSNSVRLQKYTGEEMVQADADGAVILYHNNVVKFATSATGIDVTGSVKSSRLTSQRDFANVFVDFVDTGVANDTTGDVVIQGYYPIKFKTDLAHDRMEIARNGDISFYEDTGTTAKLFWDASAERLGIGTSSPSEKLEVLGTIKAGDVGGTNGDIYLQGKYSNGALVTIGSERSSGGVFLGYGVSPSTTTQGEFLSASSITMTHGAYVASNTHKWWTASSGSSVAVGSQVTTMTERMRISADGNVGIQQDDPDSFNGSANQLVIGNSSGSRGITIRSGSSNSGNLFFSDGATGNQQYRGYIQYDHTNDRLNLGAGAADQVRITSSATVINEDSNDHDFRVESNGNSNMLFVDGGSNQVRIGTGSNVTFGDARLQVLGPSTGWNIGLDVAATTSTSGAIGIAVASGSSARVLRVDKVGIGIVGTIDQSNSGVTYNTTSDRRLKDNIEPISDATDKLMNMNPVTHTWIDSPDEPQVHGFIAQEMQEVIPEAVSGDAESDEMMSMDYGRITPVIVAALQDALKEIKELKTRIDELENK